MATRAEAAPIVPKKASYTGLILPISMIVLAIILFLTLDTKVAAPDFTPVNFATYALILFSAGMMSGLTGFAFSAIGALTLFLLTPIVAVPLLQGLSASNQMLSIGKLRKDMPKKLKEWFPYGPGPAILAGLAGVEAGNWLLYNLPAQQIKAILGTLIVLYALYMLFKPAGAMLTKYNGWKSGVVVGALGGAIGGFTAFPGLTVVVWTGLRDVAKTASRAIVQPFILALQIASIARNYFGDPILASLGEWLHNPTLIKNAAGHPQNFGIAFWTMMALSVPVVLPGTLTGVWLYNRISELNFKRACFLLLGIAGVGLVLNAYGPALMKTLGF